MKRFFYFLTAVVLCVCLAACREETPETQPNETVVHTEQSVPETSVPVTEQPETVGTDVTIPFGAGDGLIPGDNVTPPDEMPDKPDADFELPPDPGKSGTS